MPYGNASRVGPVLTHSHFIDLRSVVHVLDSQSVISLDKSDKRPYTAPGWLRTYLDSLATLDPIPFSRGRSHLEPSRGQPDPDPEPLTTSFYWASVVLGS